MMSRMHIEALLTCMSTDADMAHHEFSGDVTPPAEGEDLQWWASEAFDDPETFGDDWGGFTIDIRACPERPDLVGKKFEWYE